MKTIFANRQHDKFSGYVHDTTCKEELIIRQRYKHVYNNEYFMFVYNNRIIL